MSIGIETQRIESRNSPAAAGAGALAAQRVATVVEFGVFMCSCPRTHRIVESGIEMDRQTFEKIGHFNVRMHCCACRNVHVLRVASGTLGPLKVR